jgi:hypothetical protein
VYLTIGVDTTTWDPNELEKEAIDYRAIRRRTLAPKGPADRHLIDHSYPCEQIPLRALPTRSAIQFGHRGFWSAPKNKGSDDQGEGDHHSFGLRSGDDTVLSKVQIVHRLINNLLYFLPIAPPLYELVNVLPPVGVGMMNG